jgi:hypothetical protein
MTKLYEEYLDKDKEFANLVTDTDKEINDFIKRERLACRDKFKDSKEKNDKIKFLMCFENVEANGLQEGINFLNENMKDCGDDDYCNSIMKEEIKLMNDRIAVIKKRIGELKDKME